MSSKIKVDTIENVAGSGNVSLGSGHNLVVPGSISAKGGAVFNEDSADVDFRVESNGETNMLFVDGGENRVGIGTTGGSGETLTVTKTGADATVRVNGVSGQEASLKLQGNNTITNTFKIASEEDDSGLTIQKWNGAAYVTHLKSDANGHITKPLQSAFLARKSSDTTNLAVNTAHTIVFNTEVFDQNADYNNSTGIFTAPVTGRYQINVMAYLHEVPNDANYVLIELVASNRSVQDIFRTQAGDTDWTYQSFQINILLDMDAGDTAKVNFYQPNGSQQVDIQGHATHAHTSFSGYLVA